MDEFDILYNIIFVIIIIFTIYYFWIDLNKLYNTGGDFAEGFKEGLNEGCGKGFFYSAEDNACESCNGLQPRCDDCICSDFGKETQDGCLAACWPPPSPPPPPLDAIFIQGSETYGPEHTFTVDGNPITSHHFITQGHCNPKGKDTTNLKEEGAYFCKSIYLSYKVFITYIICKSNCHIYIVFFTMIFTNISKSSCF